MELVQMNMKNYRRFFEDTTIDFASGSKNVTIIRAENGSGKTGILMALLFGLFGMVRYDQFQIQDDHDFMVSSYLLENNKSGTCTISVDFLEEGIHYTIKRSITASNISGHIQQQDESSVETTLFKEGIDTKQSKEQIDAFMNSIVGQNIRGFLFFDGVKYTDLFKKNDKSTKKELQNIIEKMLNINDLDSTIKTIKGLQASVGANSTGSKIDDDYAGVKTSIANLKNERAGKEKEVETAKTKIEKLKKAKEDAINKFSNISEYKGICENIKKCEGEIETQKSLIAMCFQTIATSGKDSLLSAVYEKLAPEGKDDFQQISFDNAGGADLVKSILANGKCICCDNPLTEEQRTRLKAYLSSLEGAQIYSSTLITRMEEDISKMMNPASTGAFNNSVQSLANSKKELQKWQKQKAGFESQLPPDEAYEELEQKLIDATKEQQGSQDLLDGAEREQKEAENRIQEIDTDLAKLEKKQEQLEQERAVASGQKQKYEFYKDTAEKLLQIKISYLIEAQKSISERANEYFLQLLSTSDKALFKRLSLSDDYSIKVFDGNEREIFGQLSAGQKLLASMAFVMGLTAVASKAKPTCNFPLVMDTPFSNLDSANRKSLIGLMPTVVKQWILTPIDTELTDREIRDFQQGGKVGKVYELNKTGISSHLQSYKEIADLLGGVKHA